MFDLLLLFWNAAYFTEIHKTFGGTTKSEDLIFILTLLSEMHGAWRVNNNKRHDNGLFLWYDWPTKKHCTFLVVGTIAMGSHHHKLQN